MSSDRLTDKTSYPFVMIPNDVIDECEVFSDATEKMIYFILKRHANSQGEQAYPSMATIAKKALCSESTVKRKISGLVTKGLITKENRYLKKGGKTSNLYTIVDFKRWVTVNHTHRSQRPIPPVTVNHEEDTSIKNPNNKVIHQQADESSFKELWAMYPKKTRKTAAFKAFQKAIKDGVTVEQIAKGIEMYKKHLEIETWKQPADGGTWFYQERWTDEYDLPQEYTPTITPIQHTKPTQQEDEKGCNFIL